MHLRVLARGFIAVVHGFSGVAAGGMAMVAPLFVVVALIMFCRFAMMRGCVLVRFSSLDVVLGATVGRLRG
jgi:hypothetical protein